MEKLPQNSSLNEDSKDEKDTNKSVNKNKPIEYTEIYAWGGELLTHFTVARLYRNLESVYN